MKPATSRRQPRLLSFALVLVMIATACGGGGSSNNNAAGSSAPTASADTTKPVMGGKIVYGLEADTTGGWCLPEARLAISGIQVTRTVYDTLAVPDENGNYKPFLAKSITHNDAYTEWTVVARDNVLFHDGSKLDGQVIKNNIDAYRGKYTAADGSTPRRPDLISLVLANIADTTLVDPMTVKITTTKPWVAFDGVLFGSGRLGIMGQAQLDDKTSCDKKLIGTGPFKLKDGVISTTSDIDLVRNPNYWQKDADGNQLPYLNELEYRALEDEGARFNALKQNTVQIDLTDSGQTIAELRGLKGTLNSVETSKWAETGYWLLNSDKEPFNNLAARQAVAYAFDADTFNNTINAGVPTKSNGPFAPDNPAYVQDTGYPTFNKDLAVQKVAEYRNATGKQLSFTLSTTNEPTTVAGAQLYQQMLQAVGIDVQLAPPVDQTTLINNAIGGQVQMFGWRNHPGGDPDTQYYWWQSGFASTTNFGKIKDPEVDRLLDTARSDPNQANRTKDYQDLDKLFGQKVYNVWTFWSLWTVGTATNVHGIFGPDLPDGGGKPMPALVLGHSVAGLFVSS